MPRRRRSRHDHGLRRGAVGRSGGAAAGGAVSQDHQGRWLARAPGRMDPEHAAFPRSPKRASCGPAAKRSSRASPISWSYRRSAAGSPATPRPRRVCWEPCAIARSDAPSPPFIASRRADGRWRRSPTPRGCRGRRSRPGSRSWSENRRCAMRPAGRCTRRTVAPRGGGSLVELARRLGYDSEAAFSRAFKRVVGVSPGAVRREQRRSAVSRAQRYAYARCSSGAHSRTYGPSALGARPVTRAMSSVACRLAWPSMK